MNVLSIYDFMKPRFSIEYAKQIIKLKPFFRHLNGDFGHMLSSLWE